MKKYQTLIIILIIIGLTALVYYFVEKQNKDPIENDSIENQLIGGQQDDHGCLSGAGYSWCEAKQKCIRIWEEGCDDEVIKLSETLKTNLGIDFTDKGSNVFNWITRDYNQNIVTNQVEGRRIEANDIDVEKLQQIETFFEENGNQDMINIADDVYAGLRGYIYHYNACVLSWQQDGNKANVQIDCGFYN